MTKNRNNEFELTIENGTLEYYSGICPEKVVLPEGIKRIGERAFRLAAELREIAIPSSVREIGEKAFEGCESLEKAEYPPMAKLGTDAFRDVPAVPFELQIEKGILAGYNGPCPEKAAVPEGVTKIGRKAFRDCSGLKEITLPEGLLIILEEAFDGCCELTDIELPGSVIKIEARAFEGCGALKEITIPEGALKIGKRAFSYCDSLRKAHIPDTVTKIGAEAFEGCCALTEARIPKNAGIGKDAFRDVPGVPFEPDIDNGTLVGFSGVCPEEVEVPAGVREIGERAFMHCYTLQKATLPEGLQEIGDSAFSCCDALRQVLIPDGVTVIGDQAFYGCENLEEITIPGSVRVIGAEAFSECGALTRIVCPATAVTGPGAFHKVPGAPFAPETEKDVLTGYNGVCPEELTVPKGVRAIGRGVFRGCKSLRKAALSEGLEEIGEMAFNGCENLKEIGLPETLVKIGYGAFTGCESLKSVRLPGRLEEIDARAFADCAALGELTIPGSVVKIGDEAFYGCSGLEKAQVPANAAPGRDAFRDVPGVPFELLSEDGVLTGYNGVCPAALTVPDGITAIREDVFRECDTLEEITIPGSVGEIEEDAFWGCVNLRRLALLHGAAVIGNSAFEECEALEEAALPDTLTKIGEYAFAGCINLEKACLPAKAEVGKNAFQNVPPVPFALQIENGVLEGYNGVCPERIDVPEGVKAIEEGLFGGCSALRELALPASLKKIGFGAFRNCENLETLTLQPGIAEIGERAFLRCSSLKELALPDTVNKIGEAAFAGCEALEKIVLPAKADVGAAAFRGAPGAPFEPVIEDGVLTDFNGVCPEKLIVPEGTRKIDGFVFRGCENLKALAVPESVSEIGDGAFENCRNLVSVSLPESAKTGENAFRNAPGVPFTLQTEDGVLYGYNGVCPEKVAVPEGAKEIASRAFYGCASLKEAVLPASVTEIGRQAFAGCGNLRTVRYPKDARIGRDAFRNAPGVPFELIIEEGELTGYSGVCPERIDVPEGVKAIRFRCFDGCKSLKEIAVPETVTQIRKNAFRGCGGLVIISKSPAAARYAKENGIPLKND